MISLPVNSWSRLRVDSVCSRIRGRICRPRPPHGRRARPLHVAILARAPGRMLENIGLVFEAVGPKEMRANNTAKNMTIVATVESGTIVQKPSPDEEPTDPASIKPAKIPTLESATNSSKIARAPSIFTCLAEGAAGGTEGRATDLLIFRAERRRRTFRKKWASTARSQTELKRFPTPETAAEQNHRYRQGKEVKRDLASGQGRDAIEPNTRHHHDAEDEQCEHAPESDCELSPHPDGALFLMAALRTDGRQHAFFLRPDESLAALDADRRICA